MRIFVGHIEIAGIAHGLTVGLGRVGQQASLVMSMPHPFDYAEMRAPAVPRVWHWLGGRIRKARHFPTKAFAYLVWKAWSWVVLIWAVRRFDTYIFIFAASITNSRFEDYLHRWLGHRVFFYNCGSDARPPYIDGPTVRAASEINVRRLQLLSRKMALRLHRRESLGFQFLNSPLTGQFHSRPYINCFAIGIPRELTETAQPPASPAKVKGSVRILHSPSQAEIKGSNLIRAMVERLCEKGHVIDFVELRGVSNAVVLDELRRCDFIIDQLYSDSPMAGFAMEAAIFGKPAVVGSYAAALFTTHAEGWALPPSLCVHPDDVEGAIERLITDADYRQELGHSAQRFVRTSWSLDAVANRYLRLFEDDIPDAWLVRPGFEYVEGCGLPEGRVRSAIQRVIAAGGIEALQLGHAPALETAFSRFAAS